MSDTLMTEGAEGAAPLSREIVAGMMPREMLHDDEVVLILTKPSLWFVIITSFRFVLTVLLLGVLGVKLSLAGYRLSAQVMATSSALLAAGRLIWALLVWSSHTYMLTNLRIVTIKGVINTSLYQANLRKLQRTGLWRPWYLRIFGVGTIGFATAATETFDSTWVMLSRPLQVHETIVAAVNKAQ